MVANKSLESKGFLGPIECITQVADIAPFLQSLLYPRLISRQEAPATTIMTSSLAQFRLASSFSTTFVVVMRLCPDVSISVGR